MPTGSRAAGLRERLTNGTEDKIGKALADLLENPLVTGTIGRAFDARDRAAQAQELALSALNLPTAADIERLTRRLRSVSQRLEGIEDGVHRLNRALAGGAIDARLGAIEEQLNTLSSRLAPASGLRGTRAAERPSAAGQPARRAAAGATKPARSAAKRKAEKPVRAAKPKKSA